VKGESGRRAERDGKYSRDRRVKEERKEIGWRAIGKSIECVGRAKEERKERERRVKEERKER
jgi:hypothetical protein